MRTANLTEWIGKNDNEAIPARVKIRVCDKFNKRCVTCTNLVGGGLPAAYDHIQALINGGENRESNLQLLCAPCHKVKTRADVGEKSRVAKRTASHLGIRPPSRLRSAGFRKAAPQRTASRPIERRTI